MNRVVLVLLSCASLCNAAVTQPKRLAQVGQCNITVQVVPIQDVRFDVPGAVVNPANGQLKHGGGVAKFISIKDYKHKRCLNDQLLKPHNGNYLDDGQAISVDASSKWGDSNVVRIIHTVGPTGDNPDREHLLGSAYQQSLDQAIADPEHCNNTGIKAIAFPAISTGIFGYDKNDATPIAFCAIKKWLERNHAHGLQEIRFVLYDDPAELKEYIALYAQNKDIFTLSDDEIDAKYGKHLKHKASALQDLFDDVVPAVVELVEKTSDPDLTKPDSIKPKHDPKSSHVASTSYHYTALGGCAVGLCALAWYATRGSGSKKASRASAKKISYTPQSGHSDSNEEEKLVINSDIKPLKLNTRPAVPLVFDHVGSHIKRPLT